MPQLDQFTLALILAGAGLANLGIVYELGIRAVYYVEAAANDPNQTRSNTREEIATEDLFEDDGPTDYSIPLNAEPIETYEDYSEAASSNY